MNKRLSSKRGLILLGSTVAVLGAGLVALSCGTGQPMRNQGEERELGKIGNNWDDLKQPWPVNCASVPPNLEFLMVDDFEVGWGARWYNFSDQSPTAYIPNALVPVPRAPGLFYKGSYNLLPHTQDMPQNNEVPWGLRALPIGGRCGSKFAMNMKGGQFLRFGGGFGHRLNATGSNVPASDSCPKGACPNPQDADLPPLDSVPPDQLNDVKNAIKGAYMYSWDLSAWDGISFWARRGPEGQVGLRISVTDKFNSEGIGIEMLKAEQAFQKGNPNFRVPRNCEPVRVCYSKCLNGKPCTGNSKEGTSSMNVCFDREAGDVEPLGNESHYQTCGKKACFHPSDPGPFDNYACRPFTLANEENEYCVPDVPGAEVPKAAQRCADLYLYTVNLTQEWQFYQVPFSELRQEGRLKQSPYLDKATIDYVFLGFAAGWLDTWVDDIAFYREKK